MKINYLILLLVVILIITILVVLLVIENLSLKKEVSTGNMFDKNVIAISNDATILEKKIIGKSMDPNYKVKVYYPYTPYAILNSTIEDKVTKEVTSLIDTSKENMIQPNQFYTLNINYEQYSYRDYISYVFFISVYTGGAHPNNTIWTITFDKVNSKFITIEDLVNNYPNI